MKKIVLLITLLVSEICYSHVLIDLDIIKLIESSNNKYAYNRLTKATGLYQITPICLKDFNNLKGKDYKLKDMYNNEKSKEVCTWYITNRIPQLLMHYGHEVTLENVLYAYNNGAKNIGIKNRKETINYVKKYKKELFNKNN